MKAVDLDYNKIQSGPTYCRAVETDTVADAERPQAADDCRGRVMR